MATSLAEIKLARLRELRDIKVAALRAGTAAARDLTASWRTMARDDQTLPDGDWRVMLWLGGRGSGKTRAGSQALAELILADTEPGEWGIVGPTYRDAWTTCIEGESGLLAAVGTTMADAVAGNSQIIASVVRGTGEVRFRNGSIVRADSADDGALRIQGKNLRGVWCIGEGEPVATLRGQVSVERVQGGDMVATRHGWRRVLAAARTKRNAPLICVNASDGSSLRCTADHPIWTCERGWVPAGSLNLGDRILTWNVRSLDRQPGMTGTVSAGTGTTPATTSTSAATAGDCISPYGKRRTDRLSPMGSSSTTSITTRATTTRQTSLPLPGLITTVTTAGERPGTQRPRRGSGPESWNRGHAVSHGGSPASDAARSSRLSAPTTPSGSAASYADQGRSASNTPGWTPGTGSRRAVPNAASSSSRRTGAPGSAPEIAPIVSTVVRVHPASRADVYDLTVDGESEFFAGGILVHNCDELGLVARWEIAWDESIAFAVRKGSSRIIATGTPKVSRPAAKLIRRLVKEAEDPAAGIVVRHLKTRDNLANLSETFYRSVVARSKGTRLERQELEGELLDDTDGALWTWDVIDRARIQPDEVPPLVRIVVAVDPAVTSGQEADETGIIVMGEGKDGHGYVLADMSMRAAPDVCMRRASTAYHDWQADRVVAEVNNGGDYIGTLLHAVDPVIPYRKVTATRGKLTRAEPLSALYAQGKIHHAGVFPDLEDQMVTWVPGGDDSPDRLDALVWCAADLRGLLAGSWLEAYGMIKCQGCGKTFSDKQHKCPECAAPVTAAA